MFHGLHGHAQQSQGRAARDHGPQTAALHAAAQQSTQQFFRIEHGALSFLLYSFLNFFIMIHLFRQCRIGKIFVAIII
jgi:hypothetical protein